MTNAKFKIKNAFYNLSPIKSLLWQITYCYIHYFVLFSLTFQLKFKSITKGKSINNVWSCNVITILVKKSVVL